MEFAFSVTSTKSVAEAVSAVEAALAEQKFSVLWSLNITQTLQSKGLEFGPEVRILEVCSAPRAKRVLETNLDMAYFLPCKIVVRSEGEGSRIGMALPTMLVQMVNDQRLAAEATEVEEAMRAAILAAR